MDDCELLDRNLRGLAALHRLVGRYAGRLVELDGAVGSIVGTARADPWLNALVCERDANLRGALEQVTADPALDQMALWTCRPDQARVGLEAGFTELVERLPAMSMELAHGPSEGASEPIELAAAGALSDAAFENHERELEHALAGIAAERARACGRRDAGGRLVAAAVLVELEGDCSVQYVATRPDSQRLGHGFALLSDALAQARALGCRTTSLQSSQAGMHLYHSLGYRTVGELELRRRPLAPHA